MPTSYRPMVLVQGQWAGNALRFATFQEASENACDLFSRWTLPTDYRVDESDDPVNYRWVDGRLHPAGKRLLREIAGEILQTWKKPYFAAVPYLQAMMALDSVTDTYGADSARSIVNYFLGNAKTWRGDDARRIKAELKELLNG